MEKEPDPAESLRSGFRAQSGNADTEEGGGAGESANQKGGKPSIT